MLTFASGMSVSVLAMFGLPGGAEMIILLLIILLLFGKRLPTAMFSVGKSITEFKKGMNEPVSESLDDDEDREKLNS